MTLWPNDLGRCIDGKQVSDLARVMSANTRNGVVPDAEQARAYAAGEREQGPMNYNERRG
jgi:hypothetical protein